MHSDREKNYNSIEMHSDHSDGENPQLHCQAFFEYIIQLAIACEGAESFLLR